MPPPTPVLPDDATPLSSNASAPQHRAHETIPPGRRPRDHRRLLAAEIIGRQGYILSSPARRSSKRRSEGATSRKSDHPLASTSTVHSRDTRSRRDMVEALGGRRQSRLIGETLRQHALRCLPTGRTITSMSRRLHRAARATKGADGSVGTNHQKSQRVGVGGTPTPRSARHADLSKPRQIPPINLWITTPGKR